MCSSDLMYAVVKTGGKQYRVAKDDVIAVEKLEGNAGDAVELDQVLAMDDGKGLTVGAPLVDGARVAAVREVAGAVLTAVLTTVISFLPVFAMEGAEGKLFKPLAYTKTFALLASIALSLTVLPSLLSILLDGRLSSGALRRFACALLGFIGVLYGAFYSGWLGAFVAAFALCQWLRDYLSAAPRRVLGMLCIGAIVLGSVGVLADHWLPLGVEGGRGRNIAFVALVVGGLLLFFKGFQRVYPRYLNWCLQHKWLSSIAPVILVVMGGAVFTIVMAILLPIISLNQLVV